MVRPATTEIIHPAIHSRYAYLRHALAFNVPAVAGGSTSNGADAVTIRLTCVSGHILIGIEFRSCCRDLENTLRGP